MQVQPIVNRITAAIAGGKRVFVPVMNFKYKEEAGTYAIAAGSHWSLLYIHEKGTRATHYDTSAGTTNTFAAFGLVDNLIARWIIPRETKIEDGVLQCAPQPERVLQGDDTKKSRSEAQSCGAGVVWHIKRLAFAEEGDPLPNWFIDRDIRNGAMIRIVESADVADNPALLEYFTGMKTKVYEAYEGIASR